MLKKPIFAVTCALFLGAVFCFGVGRLFLLRYASGDVYPPYSTLRADPLGAKGLYAALSALPGSTVRRNFQPLKKLPPGPPITLVYAGVNHRSYWSERELQEFDTLILNGGRAIFAFYPLDRPPEKGAARREDEAEQEKEATKEKVEKKSEGDSPETTERSALIPFREVAQRYGWQFDYLPAPAEKAFDRHAFLFAPGSGLERDISWHSALYFSELSPEWRPLYLSETQPVVIERTYGRGSILLASDSYFLSNEALRRERHPQLLARVFAGPRTIIFDEDHLGVSEQPGLVQLALKYRLHGVIAGLVLLAALFVWKNAAPFIPPHAAEGGEGAAILGKEAAQGFVNLLHRTIAPADLLGLCVDEWRRAGPHPNRAVAQVEESLVQEQSRPRKQRNPLAAYRAIAETLHRKS